MRHKAMVGWLLPDPQTDSQSAVAQELDAAAGSGNAPEYPPAGRQRWVAYLSPADNVLRPLLCCLREVSQPVMSPPNPFSTPRLPRLACLGAHRAALHPHAQPVSCFRPSAAEAMAAPGTIVPL